MEYLYSLSLALFLTIALIPLLIRVSGRLGLVDEPAAERKVHTTAMPRTGGLAIIIGVALPLLFLLPLEGYLRHLFMGCAIIVVFGLWDDRVELNYKWKLFGQSLAAIVVMSGGIVLHQFPFFGLSEAPVWLTYPVTFVFLVGVVNGVNFSDGLDGLAAGTSIMALLLIFVLALQSENSALALIALTLVGGALGFLRYNTFPANIFMGDAGSQFLGFVIACLAIAVTQSDTSPYSVLLPILILGIPIMDIVQVVPVRIHKNLPLPGPDKEHFHHQLGKLGFRHVEVVAVIYLLQTVLMSGAFLLRYETDFSVALFYTVFAVSILGALLLGNACNWQFRYKQRRAARDERRNKYLRRINWYYYNSVRVVALLLGTFFLAAGWRMGDHSGWLMALVVLLASLAVGVIMARFDYSKQIFRVFLYSATVIFAYQLAQSGMVLIQEYWLVGYMAALIISLVLAIRMTRRQEFSLTNQDLLILLLMIVAPMLPFEFMEQYPIGGIAIIAAVLMYTSEFVLVRDTRMVAFSSAGAMAAVALLFFNRLLADKYLELNMFSLAKCITNIGLVILIAIAVSACGGGEKRQAEYLQRAQEHFDAGNLEKATLDVKNVLQINPNNVEAHYLRALIAQEEQDYRAAFGELNLIAELDPTHVGASIKLARLTLLANDMERARTRAQAALELAPDNAEALAVMAGVAARDQNNEEAQKYALAALQIDPAQEIAIRVMMSVYGQDNLEKSLQIIDEGIAVDPTSTGLHILRIRYLEALDKTDEVVAEYQVLIELNPEVPAYVGQLAEYYVAKYRTEEAEALLRDSIQQNPDTDEFKLYLVRYLKLNVSEEAATAELETMLAEDPESPQLRILLAQQLVNTGDSDRARKVLMATFDFDVKGESAQTARVNLARLDRGEGDVEGAKRWIAEALEIEPENASALLIRAQLKLAEGNYEETIPDLRTVLRSTPDSIPALLLMADAQQKTGSPIMALENYRSVLALQPKNTIALYQSATLLVGQQDYDAAIDNLKTFLEAQPDNIQAINLLIGIYSQEERWDEAKTTLEKLSENENTQAVADLLSAGLELRQRNFEQSLKLAKSALEQNADLQGAVPIVASSYAGMGDLDSAIAFVQPYLEKYPDNVSLSELLARLYLSNKESDKAADVLKQSIALSPDHIPTYIFLAQVYYSQGSIELIEELYRQGIQSNPDNVTLRGELSNRYLARGENELALAQLEEAYKLDDDSMMITNNLSSLLLDHFPSEENVKRVQEMTQGYENSDNPAQLDTMGWLQYRLGNFPQAINLLVAAQKAGGQGPDYWYHLGMAYYKNDQPELAREKLEKLLADGYSSYHARALVEETLNNLGIDGGIETTK